MVDESGISMVGQKIVFETALEKKLSLEDLLLDTPQDYFVRHDEDREWLSASPRGKEN